MRKTLFAIFQIYASVVIAQEKVALNTPFYWLKDASVKASAKDTLAVFSSLTNAVHAGLYDPQAISRKTFIDILSTKQMSTLEKAVFKNRSKLRKPAAIKVSTSDIKQFWDLFPYVNDASAQEIFFKKYILGGSVGLQTFYQIRMNSKLGPFIEKVRSSQKYYSSIKEVSNQFHDMTPQFITAARKLEQLYPESIFPPIYFIIGNLNNVGTADGYAGLLIGTEHLCSHANVDTSQLTENDRMVLFDNTLAVPLIVHEYVHIQQKNTTEKTLLDFAIMEGAADFITFLITGKFTDTQVYNFGFSNEEVIWKHFKAEMNSDNTDNWLFNTYDPKTGYPGNMGYFVGYKICESYYKKSSNKRQAIKEMLEIKDFQKFLLKSGYKQ